MMIYFPPFHDGLLSWKEVNFDLQFQNGLEERNASHAA